MKVSRRAAVAAGVGVLPAYWILDALGQEVRPGVTAAVGMDGLLAPWLMADGYKQIHVSRYALDRSRNDQVKEFARAEIKEHEDLKSRLERMGFRPPVATGTSTTPGTSPRTTPPPRPVTPPPPAGTAVPPRPGTVVPPGSPVPPGTAVPPAVRPANPIDRPLGTDFGVGSLKQELAERCVVTLRGELGKKSGLDFDKAYIGQQLAAHQDLLDTVQVFERHAGAELRRTLTTDAQPVIEKHIAWLHRIMKDLEAARERGPSR